jgi:psiF repeat
MVRMSHERLLVVTLLSLAMSVGLPARATAQSHGSSGQDKAKTCNSAADRKGLKGDERKTFMQDCLNKAGNEQLNGMSQKDKMDVCKNIADKKNLTGADRRSFLKDCMNKANPK